MATCSFIKESKQTAGAMHGVMRYVAQEQKTLDEDGTRYLTGVNCMADLAYQSFMATKNLYGKAHDTFFYQYVQSFSPQEQILPAEAHGIALELAERFFPDCEVLIATHLDTEHLHSHFIINSVQPNTGKKLHFTPRTRPVHAEALPAGTGRKRNQDRGVPGRRPGRKLEIPAYRCHRGRNEESGKQGGLHPGDVAAGLRRALGGCKKEHHLHHTDGYKVQG